jgi:hypothetical protein
MSSTLLGPEQEASIEALADKMQEANRPLLVKLARLLLSKKDSDLFGQTEFEVRDLVHLIGARAYETTLAEKKTATRGPA